MWWVVISGDFSVEQRSNIQSKDDQFEINLGTGT